LYIAGSFNNWDPGHKNYKLKKNVDGIFSFTLPKDLASFQYKITRGSWATVEGDINGKKTEDRKFSITVDGPVNHSIEVVSWEDMALFYSWNIIVARVPDNTPYDAPIFISGSFNEWKERDYQYRLTKFEDGTYGIKIPKAARDTIWYKFHRGSWTSVESRSNGKTQFNRVSAWDKSKNSTTISTEILAWEDIGGNVSHFFTFALIASAIQAVVLIFSLLSIKNKNTRITQVLIALLLITAIALLAKLTTYNRFVFNLSPKILLLSDVAYFLYPSIFYLLVTRIAGVSFQSKYLKWIFIGTIVLQFLLYLPVLILPRLQFILDNIDGHFNLLFNSTAFAAAVFNTVIFLISVKLVLDKHKSVKNYGYQPSYSYLITLLIHSGLTLSLWILSFFIFGLAPVLKYNQRLIHEYTIDTLWIVFAFSPYIHTFLMLRKPELFKLKEQEDKKSSFQKENLESLKSTLTSLMKRQRPFLNAKLGLQELAELMKVNIHTLSWIINEGYNKNFFDYINEHRIEEFKRLVANDQYKNYTLLAIAMEVGFSSKTTFNRAFKKSCGKTPREYFNNVQESQLEGMSE
jgi:AraC-like DNA-binding protein